MRGGSIASNDFIDNVAATVRRTHRRRRRRHVVNYWHAGVGRVSAKLER